MRLNTVKIKAIIKHCKLEGTSVCYFKSGKNIYKMTGKKNVRKTSYPALSSVLQYVNVDYVTPVFEDEQVLLDGKPVYLSDSFMGIDKSKCQKYGWID